MGRRGHRSGLTRELSLATSGIRPTLRKGAAVVPTTRLACVSTAVLNGRFGLRDPKRHAQLESGAFSLTLAFDFDVAVHFP